jgi:TonB family protein
MSEIWKRWEGQVIDRKYQLRQFLGSTDHSAVFLAEFRDPEPRQAAVKFLAGDLAHAEQVLTDWQQAQQLSHPNLLAIYSVGRCRIEDMELLYAAMEYAEENLSEILPHRALTIDEAREMLGVTVEVLTYLHGKNLTHGHIKPSNIVAIGDQLKLTSDTIQSLAEAREMRRERDAYDAPEIPRSAFTPAADVWSLGVTLVEALTQQPAFLPFNENVEPVISTALREPFREIAGRALRRDPQARWSGADIALRLNLQPVQAVRTNMAAAAAASSTAAPSSGSVAVIAPPVVPSPPPSATVSPLAVPLSKEPAVPLSKLPTINTVPPRPPLPPPPAARAAAKPESDSRETILLPNYVLAVAAALLIVLAVIALPKILHRTTESAASSKAPAVTSAPATPAAPDTSAAASTSKQPDSSAPVATPTPAPSQPATATDAPWSPAPAPAISPAPAMLHNSNSPSANSPRKASGSPDRGEVLDQILPRPSSSALSSIQGTVRVIVKVHVDSAGNVSQAALENAGPSKYFAEKALEAARGWVFLSPAEEGHSIASEWLIRFEFTPNGVNSYPTQIKP